MEPRDVAILFIMKFRRNLIIKEIMKCLALSIILALLTYSPRFTILFNGINNPFLPTLIFGFFIFYLLFFKSQIKRIKDNILVLTQEELENRVREENNEVIASIEKEKVIEKKDKQLKMMVRYKKISDHERILNTIRILMFADGVN